MKNVRVALGVTLLPVVALAGCSSFESTLVGEDADARLDFLVEVPGGGSDVAPDVSPSFTVEASDDAGNELVISTAELVLREVEFRRSSTDDCVDAGDPAQDDGDPCVEFLVNPALLLLPVEQGDGRAGTVSAPQGTYEALEFDLHRAEEGDTRVLEQRPEIEGGSVFVSGFYNDRAVSATFAPTGPVELLLADPLQLTGGAFGRLTLTVEVASWFRADDGSLVDPEAAVQDTALSREVRERILDSFSARSGF